jgi:hypothetical protein
MNGAGWVDELNGLLARFSGMGITADIAALSLCELWGVYCFLRRLAEA